MNEIKLLLKDLRKANAKISRENGSLKIVNANELSSDLVERIKRYENDLLDYYGRSRKADFTRIEPIGDSGDYAVSSSQRRLWVQSKLDSMGTAYNVPTSYRIRGGLDVCILGTAFAELLGRHEILRTVFRENAEGEVRQVVVPMESLGFDLREEDLTDREDPISVANTLLEGEFTHGFDLGKGPLFRVSIYRTAPGEWILGCVMHHIISDGWSMEVLIRELLDLYHKGTGGSGPVLEPLRIQYRDYAAWECGQLEGETFESHRRYWLERFSGELPLMEGLGDGDRPLTRTYSGDVMGRSIAKSDLEGLREIVQERGGSLFMGLLAVVNALLYKYTGQTDIVIGCPTAGRQHADLEDQIGCYLNVLAMRTHFSGDDSFLTLLDKVREVSLGAFEHQVFPFDALIEQLDLRRDAGRNPIFDVLMDFHEARGGIDSQVVGDLDISSYAPSQRKVSKYDLTFMFVEKDDGLHLSV